MGEIIDRVKRDRQQMVKSRNYRIQIEESLNSSSRGDSVWLLFPLVQK